MNFCLPTVDGFLIQQHQALGRPSGQGVASEGAHDVAIPAAAAGGPSASPAPAPPNSLKSLLHQIAGVAAAAQRIPVGDDYTIRTSTSSSARRATEGAAADTLRILLELAVGCYGGGSGSFSSLRKAEALHRSLAACTGPSGSAPNGSSICNSALLQQDGLQIHEGVGTGVQGLLDELLEAVDVSLEAHRRNPQKKIRTRLPQEQQQEQQEQQKKEKQEQQHDGDTVPADGTASPHSSRRAVPLPGFLAVLEGRPQSNWAFLINNNSRRFVPRLQQKPHKKYPLPAAAIEAEQRLALRLEKRRDLFEDAVSTALALETATGQQRQLLLQQLQQQEQNMQKLQQEEDDAQKSESAEPLPHPYEGELKALQWLLQGDQQQPDVYSGMSTSSACHVMSSSCC